MYYAMKLIDLFTKNLEPKQKQYEVLRAAAFKKGSIEDIAKRFGYTPQSVRVLINRVLSGKQQLFPKVKRGPKGPSTSQETIQLISQLRRKRRLSSREIVAELNQSNISIGVRTVERILADAGFPKLPRRTHKERGISKV